MSATVRVCDGCGVPESLHLTFDGEPAFARYCGLEPPEPDRCGDWVEVPTVALAAAERRGAEAMREACAAHFDALAGDADWCAARAAGESDDATEEGAAHWQKQFRAAAEEHRKRAAHLRALPLPGSEVSDDLR